MGEAGVDERSAAEHRLRVAALRDSEHVRLGLVDGLVHVGGSAVAQLGDLACGADEAPPCGVIGDDAGIARRVARHRRAGLHLHERAGAAHGVQEAEALQLRGDGDGVDRLAAAVQADDRLEHVSVRRPVEVGGLGQLHRIADRRGGQQHRPQQRRLGGQIVRRHPTVSRDNPFRICRSRGALLRPLAASGC